MRFLAWELLELRIILNALVRIANSQIVITGDESQCYDGQIEAVISIYRIGPAP
ncbi:MAG: hypothetical protein ACR2NP_08210 [Pirellulaceae bacterium]